MEGEKVKVLDHGYVQCVEHWGSDERIVEAARMSTNKGFQGWGPPPCKPSCASWIPQEESQPPFKYGICTCGNAEKPGDEKLLRYLYEHKHMTPFEMAGMTVEVQAPIFVFREWHRHRTQSYNELSARYTPMPDVNYVPTIDRLMMTSDKNRQAQGTGAQLTEFHARAFIYNLEQCYEHAEVIYQHALGDGVPKELARLCIPVGRYSRMRASANLRNWLAFLTLRMDAAAQWEIRQYAGVVGDLIAEVFPRTWQLFNVKGPVIK